MACTESRCGLSIFVMTINQAMKRIERENRTLPLALTEEGNTINGICGMLKIGKPNLQRFLKVVGEDCEDWRDEHPNGIQVTNLELDEQWANVGKNKERTSKREKWRTRIKGIPGFGPGSTRSPRQS